METTIVAGVAAIVRVSADARRNSPHEVMKANIAAARRPGVATGRSTFHTA